MRVITTMLGLGWLALGGAAMAQSTVTVTTIGGGPLTTCGPTAGYSGGTLEDSQFDQPYATALDAQGDLYLADRLNSALWEILAPVGSGSLMVAITMNSPNNVHAFPGVMGVAIDPANNLYVLTPHYILEFNQFLNLVASNNPSIADKFTAITAAQDGSGRVFVASTNSSGAGTIWRFNMNDLNLVQVYSGTWSPAGLTLTSDGQLVASDLLNNAIVSLATNATTTLTLIAGGNGAGFVEGIPSQSKFNQPHGVAASSDGHIVVADTGNNRVRVIDPLGNTTTIYGTSSSYWGPSDCSAGEYAGWLDGVGGPIQSYSSAEARQPVSVTLSPSGTLYVTELYYNLLREVTGTGLTGVRVFQPPPPQPPVTDPVFGYVTFNTLGSVFNATSAATFNNFVPIAVEAEGDAQTFVVQEITPTNLLNNPLVTPGPDNGNTPPIYPGDGSPGPIPTILQPQFLPHVTLYAISEAAGRGPSDVVQATFLFQCANPVIVGDNAASIELTDITTNAVMYYTLDGSTPTNGSSPPITSGQMFSINLQSNATLTVRAFAPGFAPSGLSVQALTIANFVANQMTFGFEYGEASSSFQAAAGQKFYAPVTLSLLPSASMYTLQFNATVTNLGSAPPPGVAYQFDSMLVKPTGVQNEYVQIPPLMFGGETFITNIFPATNGVGFTTNVVEPTSGFTNGMFTNGTINLLGVSWVERAGETNLYNTTSQQLISFSLAKDILHLSSSGKVIVGGYSFVVPKAATNGSVYQIQLGRPSASADGIGVTAALIVAPTNGSLTNGPINAIKNVTVGSAQYLVGDVNNFRWFNAGDFGDGNLDASDVAEVFQSAIYRLNTPPFGCDMYDAMDSSDAELNPNPALWDEIFNGTDASANALINSMQYGDGFLDISDVYVTLRRSLDPTLTWYVRYWSNGVLNVQSTSNAPVKSFAAGPAPVKTGIAVPHTLTVAPGQIVASGSTAVVPLRVLSADPNGSPIRALMFDIQVQALDGSPAITSPITFTPGPGLGAPFASLSQGPQDIAAAWLDTTVAGITGTNNIGSVNIVFPAGVNANSAYRIVVTNFSASPNGLGVFQTALHNGLVTLSDRSGSSWNDGISDSWRLLYFGTVSDPSSAANADPDGDGAPNWQEYLAGTDPLNGASVFKLQATSGSSGSAFTLQWPTVVGKHYTLQSSTSGAAGSWTTLLNMVGGTGNQMNWTDANGVQVKFFRALVQ